MDPCDHCGGSGRVPRVQRRRDDGTPDPFDIVGRHHGVCAKCAGSGEMPARGSWPTVRGPGYAADLS